MKDKELYEYYRNTVLNSKYYGLDNVVIIVPQHVFVFLITYQMLQSLISYPIRDKLITFMGKPLIVGVEDIFTICTHDNFQLTNRDDHPTHFEHDTD